MRRRMRGIKIAKAMPLQTNAKPQVMGNKEYNHVTVWNVGKGKTVRINKMRNPVQKTIVVIIGNTDFFKPRSVAAERFMSKFSA